jgi:uncharacterized protein
MTARTLAPLLLELLVCPQCKGDLVLAAGEAGLDCRTCKLRYPIRDGIPVMLIAEAQFQGDVR